jgi:aryl-alcohol dehydrogenase-like predicted oxidoreductase
MKYKNISGTDIEISSICLGTANFGTVVKEEDAYTLMDSFIDNGGNFLDTAHIYNDWIPGEKSRSEKIIGKWMKSRKNREDLIIGTKGGHPLFDAPFKPRLTKEELSKDVKESLEYLQTDYIDVYWLHRDAPNVDIAEIIDILTGFQKEGYIRYFACSNWRVERIKEAVEYAKGITANGFVSNQMQWSLAKINTENQQDKTLVGMDKDMMRFHNETMMTALPYSSQAGGFFSKLSGKDISELPDNIIKLYQNSYNIKTFNKIKEISADNNISINAVSLSYLTSYKSFPTVPIVGCRNTRQLDDSLKSLSLNMPADVINWLEEGRFV